MFGIYSRFECDKIFTRSLGILNEVEVVEKQTLIGKYIMDFFSVHNKCLNTKTPCKIVADGILKYLLFFFFEKKDDVSLNRLPKR